MFALALPSGRVHRCLTTMTGAAYYSISNRSVVAGLDPAIHEINDTFAWVVDAWVKPGHDDVLECNAKRWPRSA